MTTISPITPQELFKNISSISDPYRLELFVYQSFRGPHNKALRKALLASMGVDSGPFDVVTLYKAIRLYLGL